MGVEPGIPPEQMKQAYRDLVSVWHPDRFANNPRLRKKAEEQLKLINIAYQNIRKACLSEGNSGQSETRYAAEEETPYSESGPDESEDHLSGNEKKKYHFKIPVEWLKDRKRILLTVCFGSLMLFFAILIFLATHMTPQRITNLHENREPDTSSALPETAQAPQVQTEEKETGDSVQDIYIWLENLKQRIAWEREEWKKEKSRKKTGRRKM